MSILAAIRISRAPMAGLVGVGIFWGAVAALLPDIKANVGASDAEMGTALILTSVGSMTTMYLVPRVNAALGRHILPVAVVLLAIACLYPTLPRTLPELALALFAMGATISLLDVSSNVRISVLEERHSLHLMNVNHAAFSFAFAASAFATGLARKEGLGPVGVMPVVAIALLALLPILSEGRRWTAGAAAPEDADKASPWAAILPAAAVLFAAFVSENAAEAWSALFIERNLGAPVGEGGFGPMMLGLTMGVGRLSGQFAAAHLGERGLVMGSAVFGIVGALVIAAAPDQIVAMIGVGFLGLGVAVVVPSVNSILGKTVRADQRGFALSRAWMFGFTGFFIGPMMMGLISQVVGLRAAFVVIALVMVCIIPAVRLMRR